MIQFKWFISQKKARVNIVSWVTLFGWWDFSSDSQNWNQNDLSFSYEIFFHSKFSPAFTAKLVNEE